MRARPVTGAASLSEVLSPEELLVRGLATDGAEASACSLICKIREDARFVTTAIEPESSASGSRASCCGEGSRISSPSSANAASSGSNGTGTAAKLCETRAPYGGVRVRPRFCEVLLRARCGPPFEPSLWCSADCSAASRAGPDAGSGGAIPMPGSVRSRGGACTSCAVETRRVGSEGGSGLRSLNALAVLAIKEAEEDTPAASDVIDE